jgi:hypothetical protein
VRGEVPLSGLESPLQLSHATGKSVLAIGVIKIHDRIAHLALFSFRVVNVILSVPKEHFSRDAA